MLVNLLFTIYSSAQNNVTLSSFQNSLQGIIDNATNNYGMDGAELSIIINDSFAVQTFYSGLRAPGIPTDSLKPWHFGAVAGTYTAYIILKLIEEGSIAMDDSIGMHMNASTLGLDGSIRIRELMRHTSPMNEMWVSSNPGPASACYNDLWVNNPTIIGCPEDILNCMPADSPSKRGIYDFNNMNLLVMGYLIDSVTGNSYESEFQNRIFNPFGMSNTYMSGCDTVTIDSINGIWTTASGYANNRSYFRYFSTNGANRGLISKTEHVAKFMRAFFSDSLLSSTDMDSVKKIIPGSAIPQGSYSCASNITGYGGYSADILEIVKTTGDTLTLYGKAGNAMNTSLNFHWPEKNWTLSFATNDRSRLLELRNIGLDLICYLEGVDSVIYPVVQTPVADFDTALNGLTVSFTDLSQNNPDTWLWDFGDGNLSSVQNPFHTYSGNGSYTVTLVVSNSAGSDTISKGLSVISSLSQILQSKIKLYPNPTEGEVIIDSELNEDYSLTVTDIYGRIVDYKVSDLNHSGDNNYQFPEELESGQYFLKIESKSETLIRKIQLLR